MSIDTSDDDVDMPTPYWPEGVTPLDASGATWYVIPDWYFGVMSHGCSTAAARVAVMKAFGQGTRSIKNGLRMPSERKVRHCVEEVCNSIGLPAKEAWPYITWLLLNHGNSPHEAAVEVVALLQRGWRICPVDRDLAT